MIKPLAGLRVVDLTHVLAGPFCTYQLGLLGAEVIKVESLKGDMVRNWGGTETQLASQLGSGFVSQNAGKRSLSIDIATPEGAAIVQSLQDSADIFVENYRPGVMDKHGLDYPSASARNSKLIYLSISAFGQNGPEGHRPGFDDVIQATSGFMSINVRGDGPIRTGGPVLDYATGMQAASSVLAALLIQAKTGEGQHIDIAMQDVSLLLMNRHASITATTGIAPEPAGNRDAPMLGRFKSKDGYVMLAGYLPHHCRRLCKALGLDEYAEINGQDLAKRGAEIEHAVEQRIAEQTSDHWDAIFSAAGVVGGGVRDLTQVLASEQLAARELLCSVDSKAGTFQTTTAGYRINDEVFEPHGDVPTLGGNTRQILQELGYDESAIDALEDASIVRIR